MFTGPSPASRLRRERTPFSSRRFKFESEFVSRARVHNASRLCPRNAAGARKTIGRVASRGSRAPSRAQVEALITFVQSSKNVRSRGVNGRPRMAVNAELARDGSNREHHGCNNPGYFQLTSTFLRDRKACEIWPGF